MHSVISIPHELLQYLLEMVKESDDVDVLRETSEWLTAVAFESRTCQLAKFGRPSGGEGNRLQILVEMLATQEGIPMAVETFSGNTGDPDTVETALDRLQGRLGL